MVSVAALVVVGTVEATVGTGAGSFGIATLGALAGAILLPASTQLGLLTGAVLFGLRVRHVVVGALRRVAAWRLGRVTVTLRLLPVVLASEIGPWRRPVVLRCWLAGVLSALAGLGAVAAGWLLADGPFGRGFVIAVTPFMLYKLWPRRAPLTTSTGWLLFGLPGMTGSRRAEFRAGASAARAHEALQAGDLERARARVDELTAEHPELNTTVSCRVSLHEARGDYGEAVALLLGHISSADLPARELSYNLAGLAGLAFSAVEAEQLPGDEVLPVAKKALHDASALGFPEFQLNGVHGLLALVEGDADEAVRRAKLGAEHATSPLSRADDLVTLARAHMARHDNAAAHRALAAAEEAAAWWPRVRALRTRLSVA